MPQLICRHGAQKPSPQSDVAERGEADAPRPRVAPEEKVKAISAPERISGLALLRFASTCGRCLIDSTDVRVQTDRQMCLEQLRRTQWLSVFGYQMPEPRGNTLPDLWESASAGGIPGSLRGKWIFYQLAFVKRLYEAFNRQAPLSFLTKDAVKQR